MSTDIYSEEIYKRFYDNLIPLLNGPNIEHVKLKDLKKPAIKTGIRTRFGSYGWRSFVSTRMAPRTVYLGSKNVRLPKLSEVQKGIIEKAPEELHNVLHFMRTLPFVHLRRQMGDNNEFNPICNLYMSVADPKNYRIAYMWGHTLREPDRKPGPEFTMIHIPEEHQIRLQILTLPEYNLNIALGTDYMGEDKKGFLRQAMWYADEHGMLGLHAGTKLVYVRDARDGKLKLYGVFLFGLTATGKSTWSCHQLGLDHTRGEKTEVAQDDIVFLRRDGSALGSEMNFFVKTDVEKDLQEAMYNALIDETALYENVMIDSNGNPDFMDENLCANGRAVIRKDKLRVKRGRRLVSIASKSIDLPSLDNLDGLIFAFITRRNTIMPFAQELTPEQGVLAYLWGESTHSFATLPLKAGESVRIVGTDDFIIGSQARKVNRFYDIIMDLVDRFPGKVRFYQYNTGGVGEILETYMDGSVQKKRLIRKATRVPINLMAAIQRGDLRGSNRYEKGRLGTAEIVACEGENLSAYDPRLFYSQEQIDAYVKDLVEGRRKFTEEIANEGLKPEIIQAAEESFRIAGDGQAKSVFIPDKSAREPVKPLEEVVVPGSWESKARPPRPMGWW
ncbi:MAG: phosphoenolpyruvate carboxykinase (ATP) [candidate division KSB1 bacterium]|nr:phosphoenolpyruvate carboxykinase (ATP) [candidate division KSB1 bacterium]